MNNFEAFFELAKPIITHPKFILQKNYRHHTTNLYDHCILVAFHSYKWAKRKNLDVKSIVRGALLHDFFLYDWRIQGKAIKKRGLKKHGFTHALTAYKNADALFGMNDLEKDIILKHMFPLNLKPPRYKESWIVNIVDNFITFKEYFKDPSHPILDYIKKRCNDS
ncbi:MAG: HD domain-containing protein [Candidatus Izemoplasmataceae bacterium]